MRVGASECVYVAVVSKVSQGRRAVIVSTPSDDELMNGLVRRSVRCAAEVLESVGAIVEVIDLVGFVPVMSPEERSAYFSAEPILDPDVRAYADLVGSASTVVFVFHARHGMLPPALKGFVDRVFVPGVSFQMTESGRVLRGLRHVDHLVGIPVYSASHRNVRRTREPGRRLLLRCMRLSCSIRTRSLWVAAYIDASQYDGGDGFISHLERRLRRRLS